MAKGGFDKLIDTINERDDDDVVGLKKKKKSEVSGEPSEQKPKKKGGFDSIIDNIKERDDEKTYGRGIKLEKENGDKPEKKGSGMSYASLVIAEGAAKEVESAEKKPKKKAGFEGMIDNIRDRDIDDAVGLGLAKKKK